jgi:quercetin dioxygenase-like cupin family protein
MSKGAAVLTLLALAVLPRVAAAQDAPEIDPAREFPDKYTVLFENEHVRVVEYTLEPGDRDGTHTHPPKLSYVLSGGTLRITPEVGGAFLSEGETGATHWSEHVGRHWVENVGDTTVRILLVEVKSVAGREALLGPSQVEAQQGYKTYQ